MTAHRWAAGTLSLVGGFLHPFVWRGASPDSSDRRLLPHAQPSGWPLDHAAQRNHHRRVDDELDPREAARVRRRDHDMDMERRDLMRPGMGKVWKQIQDTWTDERRIRRTKGRTEKP